MKIKDNFKAMSLEEIKEDPWLSQVMCKGFEDIFYNQYTHSTEAYFGRSSPLPMCILKYIKQIRMLYETTVVGGARKPPQDKKALYKLFKKTIDAWEKEMEKILNCESMTIGLMVEKNAYAYPMCWDRNLIKKTPKGHKTFNKELQISLEDIVETKDGFRFRTKEGKSLIMCIGLDLIADCTDEECVGVVLHELGHCFQHMLVGITGNVANHNRKSCITTLWLMLNPVRNVLFSLISLDIFGIILSILVFICAGFIWLIERGIKHTIDEVGEDKAGEEMILNAFDSDQFDRTKFAEETREITKDSLRYIIKSSKANIVMKFIGMIIMLLINTLSVLYFTTGPILQIFAIPSHLVTFAYHKYLRKERRYEQFADMFSTIYGYGGGQSRALAKLYVSDGADLGAFNFLHYVPMVNVWIAFTQACDFHSQCLMAGYPPPKERIESLYVSLEFELKKNDKLSPKAKQEIQEQMDEIRDTFNNYVYSNKASNLVFKIFNAIRGANIATNRKTDIVENVLQPLYDVKKEAKELAIKNNSSVIDPVTKKLQPGLVSKMVLLLNAKIDFEWIKKLGQLPAQFAGSIVSTESLGSGYGTEALELYKEIQQDIKNGKINSSNSYGTEDIVNMVEMELRDYFGKTKQILTNSIVYTKWNTVRSYKGVDGTPPTSFPNKSWECLYRTISAHENELGLNNPIKHVIGYGKNSFYNSYNKNYYYKKYLVMEMNSKEVYLSRIMKDNRYLMGVAYYLYNTAEDEFTQFKYDICVPLFEFKKPIDLQKNKNYKIPYWTDLSLDDLTKFIFYPRKAGLLQNKSSKKPGISFEPEPVD